MFAAVSAEGTGPAAESASSCRRSVRGDTRRGVGFPSSSLASSSSSLSPRAVRPLGAALGPVVRNGRSKSGAWSEDLQMLSRRASPFTVSLSKRKSAASSRNHVGRTPLCPPSKTRRTLSPAQALCKSCVWCGSTNVSSEATPNSAGQRASGAQLMGMSSRGSNAALVRTSVRIMSRAQTSKKAGTGNLPRFTSSSATVRRSRKAESRTQAARSASSAARSMEVVAPMDLPHNPIDDTFSWLRRCCSTTLKSFSSWCPSEIYSPSDRPEPERSRQKTVRSRGSSTGSASNASSREEQLPCRYTTHGRFASGDLAGTKWLHSKTPRLLRSCRSRRS
mmetsp:Transcript_148661/g.477357  ORF Transcript_148661/g.477357 Transcript_148661/m.477357 type:complete len:335 (+) Transcript_148661:560-1564(+)